MKTKKNLLKILLICIILMLLLSFTQISYGSILGGLAVVGLQVPLIVAIQWLVLVVGIAAGEIIDAITGLADGKADAFLSQVLFNKVESVRANFFPSILGGKPKGAIETITQNIGEAYAIIRNLSIALLLIVLIYIGIRMAISTVASEEAKYKKMFKDWVVSLALVFVLHFIIIVTFYFNDVLVETLYRTMGQDSGINMRVLAGNAAIPIVGWPETIMYVSLVTSSLAFVLIYLKRIITLGFLIVIAPLITVTYSIDKVGDGKSQALNTWLKEFIYTVLIQPFHCVIYIVFVRTAFNLVTENHSLESEVLAVMSVLFMLKAEGIVKKIFGINADSMADALSTGAAALGVITALKGNRQAVSKGKGKMPVMKGNVKTKDEAGGNPPSGGGDNPPSGGGNPPSGGGDNPPAGGNNPPAGGNNPPPGGNNPPPGGNNPPAGGNNPPAGGNNPPAGGNNPPPGGNNPPPGGNNPSPAGGNASNKPKKKKEPSKLAEEIRNHYKRKAAANGFNGPNAIMASRLGSLATGAATVIGATMGATTGDVSTAINNASAFNSMASGIEGRINDYENQKQLDSNQQYLAGGFEEYAKECRKEFGEDLSNEEIMNMAIDMYEGGDANLDEGYQLDFYKQMDDLKTSAEIMGYSDGFDYVKDSMRMASEGRIKPPSDYEWKNYKYTEELYQRDLKKIMKAENGTNGPMYTELRELDELIAANRGNKDAVDMYTEMRRQKMERFKSNL